MAEQLKVLEKCATANMYKESKGIMVWIESEFGIHYSYSGVNTFIKRLSFIYKNPF